MINSLLLFHVLHQAVRPSTGDVVYDEFEDGPSFAELETRFEHIAPEELLLPESVTLTTENFIRGICHKGTEVCYRKVNMFDI